MPPIPDAEDQPADTPLRRPSLVQRRLRLQLRLFLLLFIIMLSLSVWHVVRDDVSPLWLLAGLVPGLALGVLLARTKVLGWDANQQSVVGRSDGLGIAILVTYLLFIIFGRDALVERWVHSAVAASVVSLAMTAGTMFSRVITTMHGIRAALIAAGVPLPPRLRR